ncbi:hypothetical protein D3C81_1164030 [compost metagenome]
MGFRQRRLRLADFEMGADAAGQTPFGQGQDLLLLLKLGLDDIALGKVQRQLDVDLDDIVLQLELGLAGLGHAHVGHVHGLLAGIALAAPEVQGVAQAKRCIVVPGVGPGQRAGAIELVFRPVVALERRLAIDLQFFRRLDHPGHGLGFAHTGGGHGHARAVLHGQGDPAIELRVAVGPPPLLVGPMGVAGGFTDRRVGGQGIGLQRLALRGNAPGSDTAAQGQAKGTGTERIERSDDATRHSCKFPT